MVNYLDKSIENTVLASITNSPCVSIPYGEMGLEIMGLTGSDREILAIAKAIDKILNN